MSKILNISLTNKLEDNAIFLIRAGFVDNSNLYLDLNLTQKVIGNKDYDCTGDIPNFFNVPDDIKEDILDKIKFYNDKCSSNTVDSSDYGSFIPKTIYFYLKSNETIDLYLKEGDKIISGIIWYTPLNSNKIFLGGPEYQSSAEFTIDNNKVWYDITAVEGISAGIMMNYRSNNNDGNNNEVICNPDKPIYDFLNPEKNNYTLYVNNTLGFNTILSDKWTAPKIKNISKEYSDKTLASCPGIVADTIQGQHDCRRFYANSYEKDGTDNKNLSYCNWLKQNNCQGYCWAMDEWQCNDKNCGWGGDNQPLNSAEIYEKGNKDKGWSKEEMDKNSNIYSCGYWNEKDGYDIRLLDWWKNKPGCYNKTVNNKPTLLTPNRNGGKFEIEFIELDWLKKEKGYKPPVPPVDYCDFKYNYCSEENSYTCYKKFMKTNKSEDIICSKDFIDFDPMNIENPDGECLEQCLYPSLDYMKKTIEDCTDEQQDDRECGDIGEYLCYDPINKEKIKSCSKNPEDFYGPQKCNSKPCKITKDIKKSKYTCSIDFKCIEDENGFFDTKQNCEKKCVRNIEKCKENESQCADRYYTCLDNPVISERGCADNPFTWINSLCKTQCKVGEDDIQKYNCDDNGNCIELDDGIYNNPNCDNACIKPIIKKYNCDDNGNCIKNENGQYNSLEECSKVCKKSDKPNRNVFTKLNILILIFIIVVIFIGIFYFRRR